MAYGAAKAEMASSVRTPKAPICIDKSIKPKRLIEMMMVCIPALHKDYAKGGTLPVRAAAGGHA